MDIVRALMIGLVCAVVTGVLSVIVVHMGKAPDSKGWRHIKPSLMHWTAIGLGAGLCLFMTYIRLFVGSSRADAATQMNILTGLIFVFGLMTVLTAIGMQKLFRSKIRFRGQSLVFTDPSGEQSLRLDDVQTVRTKALGAIEILFSGGQSLKIDPHAQGVDALMERLMGGERLKDA